MDEKIDIDALLKSPSNDTAHQLVEWANSTRLRITRGDMMLGILSMNEVTKIPMAYRAAAEQGENEAWITLAWWFACPEYGEPDLELAESAINSAINSKVNNAKLELVKLRWFFKRETATEAERREAFDFTSELTSANPDNSETLYFLGLLTTHGFGVAASPETGFQLQQKSADLGNVDAMFEIYIHFVHGLGIAPDEQAAISACQRAAEAGHARAMYNVGAFNASGRGMPKNIPEAIKWYQRAADVGNPSAMAGLATIYATGDGVEQDLSYAEELFDQADYCGLDVSHLREQVGLKSTN